ncbi:hypothetical protein BH10CYA1_BH10CYA1_34630 [soil metagenome]
MRKAALAALINLTLFVPTTACFGQTAEQINSLLNKSKFVDTGRTVNTVVGADKTTISTYCNPKSSDQDCKVTALLMMKEIKQHYQSIHRIHVLFYDPRDPHKFRDVEIREGDTLLVDQGKPLSVVLSEIDVGHHTSAPPPNSVSSRPTHSLVSSSKSGQATNSIQPLSFETFKSSDSEASVSYPKNWTVADSDGNFILFKVMTQSGTGTAIITLYRHPAVGVTVESMADSHIAEGKAKTKNFKEISRRIQSCNGLPALTLELSAQWSNGTDVVERAGYVRGQNHIYMLDMLSSGLNENEMNRLFQTVFSSMHIRS